jgi:hypothetical protein
LLAVQPIHSKLRITFPLFFLFFSFLHFFRHSIPNSAPFLFTVGQSLHRRDCSSSVAVCARK